MLALAAPHSTLMPPPGLIESFPPTGSDPPWIRTGLNTTKLSPAAGRVPLEFAVPSALLSTGVPCRLTPPTPATMSIDDQVADRRTEPGVTFGAVALRVTCR